MLNVKRYLCMGYLGSPNRNMPGGGHSGKSVWGSTIDETLKDREARGGALGPDNAGARGQNINGARGKSTYFKKIFKEASHGDPGIEKSRNNKRRALGGVRFGTCSNPKRLCVVRNISLLQYPVKELAAKSWGRESRKNNRGRRDTKIFRGEEVGQCQKLKEMWSGSARLSC